MRRLACALALGAAACARRLPSPPAAPVVAASPGLSILLLWDAPVDLDLVVTEPALASLYFASRTTPSGGVLEADARCAERMPGVQTERARWPAPPAGRYRVGVDYPEACGGTDLPRVRYRIVVDVDGRRRELVGTAHIRERALAVLEVDLP